MQTMSKKRKEIIMDRTDLETRLLDKLASGELDGIVGADECREAEGRVCRRMIMHGLPLVFNFPVGKDPTTENVVLDSCFETEEMKLLFLQTYGWKMEDSDVKRYSIHKDCSTALRCWYGVILYVKAAKKVARKWIDFLMWYR